MIDVHFWKGGVDPAHGASIFGTYVKFIENAADSPGENPTFAAQCTNRLQPAYGRDPHHHTTTAAERPVSVVPFIPRPSTFIVPFFLLQQYALLGLPFCFLLASIRLATLFNECVLPVYVCNNIAMSSYYYGSLYCINVWSCRPIA